MRLKQTIVKAKKLIQTYNEEQLENVLYEGMKFVEEEQDINIILSYLELCKEWGSIDNYEKILRYSLNLKMPDQQRLEVLQSFLDFINRERLFSAKGLERVELLHECIKFSTQAMGIISEDITTVFTYLLSIRAEGYLDLAREGELNAAFLAYKDIKKYINLIKKAETIPDHWNKDSLIAFKKIDLAETIIISKDDTAQAITLLESAIQTIETNQTKSWATERAYDLLDKALILHENTMG